MTEILKAQLTKLQTARFKVDGKEVKTFPESFSEIVFYKKNKEESIIKIIFEDYIINPFPGFDFHDKWNNGIKPYSKIMYGKIIDETKGMYKFKLHSESNDKLWIGWCPKKSCSIEKLY